MSDGKISVPEVAEDFVGSCTNAIDNIATDMGLPTPSSLYTALMPGGTGVISKDFANLLGKKMDKENKKEEEKLNEGEYTVLKFKIVTSDKENWSMDVPTRKTEKGFEIATAINNHNKTKDFEVLLCTDERAGTDMYQIKNQLEELRSQKLPFDIYVNDKDVYNQYKLSNCLFSNLDFNPNGKNSINCSMSIVEVPEWDVQIIKLDSSYKGKYSTTSSAKNASSAKSGVAKSVKSATNATKTATTNIKNTIKIKPLDNDTKELIKKLKKTGISKPLSERTLTDYVKGTTKDYSTKAIVNSLKEHGINVSTSQVNQVLSEGQSISATPKKTAYWDMFGNIYYK